jgi:hypothetical protein
MQVCVKKKPGINPHTCLLQALSNTNSLLQTTPTGQKTQKIIITWVGSTR